VIVMVPPGVTVFQSSPVPKDGRYIAYFENRRASECFNPRPSRRTGATTNRWLVALAGNVFQSSPVPKDGRYTVADHGRAVDAKFQSSPVPKDGRYASR